MVKETRDSHMKQELHIGFKLTLTTLEKIRKIFGIIKLRSEMDKSSQKIKEIFRCVITPASVFEIIQDLEKALAEPLLDMKGSYTTTNGIALSLNTSDMKITLELSHVGEKKNVDMSLKSSRTITSFPNRKHEFQLHAIYEVPVFIIKITSIVPREKEILLSLHKTFIENNLEVL